MRKAGVKTDLDSHHGALTVPASLVHEERHTGNSESLVGSAFRGYSAKRRKWNRHERSHTGSRPFVCGHCKRAFSRQDSLIRHEKLHTRSNSESSPAEWTNEPAVNSTQPSSHFARDNALLSTVGPTQGQGVDEPQIVPSDGLQHLSPAAELDFELMWPDSEDLFQTLISHDAANQWQMPLGTLQLSADLPRVSDFTYPTPGSQDDRVSSIGTIPFGGNHQAVHGVSRMVANLTSSVTAAVESTSITSVFLDECLHMFFVRFIPTFPILHRATFVFRHCTHHLLLHAIAIGSLYLGPKVSVAKGEALWRLAHTAVATSWQTLITHRGPYDACEGIQLVLSALLGQVYGALSENRVVRKTSQAFRALGFFWARHSGMYEYEPFSTSTLPSLNATEEDKERCWRVWAAREIQQRVLLGHYLLDGLITQMSGQPTSVRHAANRLFPPSSEAAFEAGTADEWLHYMYSSTVPQLPFRSILRLLFASPSEFQSLNQAFSAFTVRVLLEGVQSFISDCEEHDGSVVGVPSRAELRMALARLFECVNRSTHLSTESRLETLLRWHAICLDAIIDSSLLCTSVCTRYNIEQHVLADKKGSRSDFDLVKWAATEDARRALLHAIAIQDIVEQLPRGRAHVIHMPSSLFAAATVYSVFSLADLATVKVPSTVDWTIVTSGTDDSHMASNHVGESVASSDTRSYIRCANTAPYGSAGSTRNLVYELNSVQKLFLCLCTQWGIAYDMEKVTDQWASLCH